MSEERNITARFTADTSGFSPAVNEIIQKLKSLNGEYAQNEQEIKRLNTTMKGFQKELFDLEKKQRENKNLTAEETAKMASLRDSIAECATKLGTYRAAQTDLRGSINQTNRELNEQRDAVNNVSNAAATFGDVLKANIISDVVHMGLQKTLELLRSAAAYCYQVGTSFEAAMSQVAAISGATAEQLEQLTAKAKELGSTTKFTATEAAGAMNYMAMAGWDAEQMLSGIDGVLSLAAASGEDLGATADIVSDAITAFGLEADRCSHFANILAAASANANTNVALMGETFKYCAADAGSLGFSAEDTVTAIGLMASAGIKGSQAGTALRKLFTEMSGDLTLASEKIGDITIKTADASGEMRPFIDIVKELRTEFAKLNPQEQTAAAKELVGQYAQTGFKTLMNASEEAFEKLTYAIENCDGAAASMAKTMQENLAGQVTIFQSALEGLGISVYDKFSGALRDTVAILTDCISDMTDSVEEGELDESISRLADSFKSAATEFAQFVSGSLPDFVDGIANTLNFVITFRDEIGSLVKGVIAFKGAMAIGDIIRAAVRSYTSLKTAISSTAGAQEVLNNTMAANPFGLVAVAIGAVITAASELEAHLDDCNQKASDTMETVRDLIDTSQRYRDTAKDLDEVITRFEEITESEEDAAKKNGELTQLQEILISLCGSEADGIDLVTDAFANQASTVEKLNGLLDEYNQKSLDEAQAALDRLNEAEQYKTALSLNSTVSGGYNTVLWAAQNLKTFDTSGTVGGQAATKWNTYGALFKDNMMYLSGSYEDRLADLITLKDYLLHEGGLNTNDEAVRNVTALIEQLQADSDSKERYTKMIANLRDGKDADYEAPELSGSAIAKEEERKGKEAAANYEKWKAEIEAERAAAEKSAEELAAQYKEEKQLADDMYGVSEISAEEYYNRLTVLRDSYLEQGSHEWYVATKEIKSLAEKLGDALGRTAKTTADKIKDALSDVKSEYQKTLDAIDAEIERHNREKQDKEYQGKVDALNARLKYEQLDIFSRRELEQELADIYEEWDETKYKRDTVDAKSLLETVYTQTQDMINAAPEVDIKLLNTTFSAAFESIGEAFAKSIEEGTATTQAVYNITINGMDKTPEQIRQETLSAISSDLI